MAYEVVYTISISLIKVSLLLMYIRIFPVKRVLVGAYILMAISISWAISLIIVALAQCLPMDKLWKPWIEGRCIDIKATFLAIAIPNIITDIAILALPIPLLWGLQTTRVRKISLSIIFLLGSFVVFTSCYRFTTFLDFETTDLSCMLFLILNPCDYMCTFPNQYDRDTR